MGIDGDARVHYAELAKTRKKRREQHAHGDAVLLSRKHVPKDTLRQIDCLLKAAWREGPS